MQLLLAASLSSAAAVATQDRSSRTVPLLGLISETSSIVHTVPEDGSPPGTSSLSWGPLNLLTVQEKTTICERVLENGENKDTLNVCLQTAQSAASHHQPLQGLQQTQLNEVCQRLDTYLARVSNLAKSNKNTAEKICVSISEDDVVKREVNVQEASCAAVQRLLSKGVTLDSVCERLSLPSNCLTELKKARTLRGRKSCDLGLGEPPTPVTPLQRFLTVCTSTLHSLHSSHILHNLTEVQTSANLLFFNSADDTVLTDCAKQFSSTDYTLSTCWDMAATYLEYQPAPKPAPALLQLQQEPQTPQQPDRITSFCQHYASWLVEEKKMGDSATRHALAPTAPYLQRTNTLLASGGGRSSTTSTVHRVAEPHAGAIAHVVMPQPQQMRQEDVQPREQSKVQQQDQLNHTLQLRAPAEEGGRQVPYVPTQVVPLPPQTVQAVPIPPPQQHPVIVPNSPQVAPIPVYAPQSIPVAPQPQVVPVMPPVQAQAPVPQLIPVPVPVLQNMPITAPVPTVAELANTNPAPVSTVAQMASSPPAAGSSVSPAATVVQALNTQQQASVTPHSVHSVQRVTSASRAPHHIVQAVVEPVMPVQPTLPVAVDTKKVEPSSPEEVDVKSDKVDLKIVEEKLKAARETAASMVKKEQLAKQEADKITTKAETLKKDAEVIEKKENEAKVEAEQIAEKAAKAQAAADSIAKKAYDAQLDAKIIAEKANEATKDAMTIEKKAVYAKIDASAVMQKAKVADRTAKMVAQDAQKAATKASKWEKTITEVKTNRVKKEHIPMSSWA